MASANHHHVPQMHQRQFVANTRSEIFVHDKRWQKDPKLKQPKGQGFQRNLYSIEMNDGVRSSKIEDEAFSKIDNAASIGMDLDPSERFEHKMTLAIYLASLRNAS